MKFNLSPQAWLDASKKHRSEPGKKTTKSPVYSGEYSKIMSNFKLAAQRLINNLKATNRDEL